MQQLAFMGTQNCHYHEFVPQFPWLIPEQFHLHLHAIPRNNHPSCSNILSISWAVPTKQLWTCQVWLSSKLGQQLLGPLQHFCASFLGVVSWGWGKGKNCSVLGLGSRVGVAGGANGECQRRPKFQHKCGWTHYRDAAKSCGALHPCLSTTDLGVSFELCPAGGSELEHKIHQWLSHLLAQIPWEAFPSSQRKWWALSRFECGCIAPSVGMALLQSTSAWNSVSCLDRKVERSFHHQWQWIPTSQGGQQAKPNFGNTASCTSSFAHRSRCEGQILGLSFWGGGHLWRFCEQCSWTDLFPQRCDGRFCTCLVRQQLELLPQLQECAWSAASHFCVDRWLGCAHLPQQIACAKLELGNETCTLLHRLLEAGASFEWQCDHMQLETSSSPSGEGMTAFWIP